VDKPVKRKAKRTLVSTETIIDGISGEVLQEYRKFRELASKTVYAIMYLDDENAYDALSGLGNQGKVWGYVIKNYDAKTGGFNFSSLQKVFMKKELQLSIGTIRSSISGFCDSGLLKRVMGADYMVNPRMFYKGEWDKRDAMIKIYDSLKAKKHEEVDS